jgi:hypothetical protein
LAPNKEIEDQFSSAVKSALDESEVLPPPDAAAPRFEALLRPPEPHRSTRLRAWAAALLSIAFGAIAAVIVVAALHARRARETPLNVEMAAKAPAAAPRESATAQPTPVASSPAATPAALATPPAVSASAATPASVAEMPSSASPAMTPARRARISRHARARHPAGAIASAHGLKPVLPEQSVKTPAATAALNPAAPSAVPPPPPASGASVARTVLVSSPDHTVYWALEAWGTIFRWTDEQSWRQQGSGVRSDLLAGEAPSNTVCWVVGRRGTILLTTDGKRWRQIKSPTNADIIGVSALSADVADIIVSDGSRLSTIDRGGYWMPTI